MEKVIDCSGIVVSNFKFPPFKLIKGEYLTLEPLFIHNFSEEKSIINIFSRKSPINGMNIFRKISIVKDINIERGIIKRLTKNISSFNYILRNTNYEDKKILDLLKVAGINPEHKIWSLGCNGRKILSLEVALTKGEVIMIITAGLDYNGLRFIRNRLKEYVDNNGTVIELNYKSSRGFESLPDSKKISIEKIII